VLSGEATNTNFIVFGFTQPGLELTIYRDRGEHANHYVTDAFEHCLFFWSNRVTLLSKKFCFAHFKVFVFVHLGSC
jgi:hypothetical protein